MHHEAHCTMPKSKATAGADGGEQHSPACCSLLSTTHFSLRMTLSGEAWQQRAWCGLKRQYAVRIVVTLIYRGQFLVGELIQGVVHNVPSATANHHFSAKSHAEGCFKETNNVHENRTRLKRLVVEVCL